ncbi:MAG TPA: histone deacetylase [Spirochaetia bacterium]|nr:histone deacetylase [Spirochaetia bacterium]
MIIYDQQEQHPLLDYGIQIPVHPGKRQRTFEFLRDHPALGPQIDRWLVAAQVTPASREDLLRVHSRNYVERLTSAGVDQEIIRVYELIDAEGKFHRYDPVSATRPLSELFQSSLRNAGGTTLACRVAVQTGFAFFFGGGAHHAKRDYGEGFCVVNDLVIAARAMMADSARTGVRQIWVIDVDVHKGDGTAELTEHDPAITTLSIHMGRGWPLDGEEFRPDGERNRSFIPSDIDIPIFENEESRYNPLLEAGLYRLSKEYPRADLAIVVCGSDPYEKDELPSSSLIRLTREQLLERDLMVYRFLMDLGIPAAYVMAGGYGRSSWEIYTQFLEKILSQRLGLSPKS